jgi:hypothetical protein
MPKNPQNKLSTKCQAVLANIYGMVKGFAEGTSAKFVSDTRVLGHF